MGPFIAKARQRSDRTYLPKRLAQQAASFNPAMALAGKEISSTSSNLSVIFPARNEEAKRGDDTEHGQREIRHYGLLLQPSHDEPREEQRGSVNIKDTREHRRLDKKYHSSDWPDDWRKA